MTKFNWNMASIPRQIAGWVCLASVLISLAACGGTGGAPVEPVAQPATSVPSDGTPTSLPVAVLETPPAAGTSQPVELDMEALRNATYDGILNGPVTLAGGVFEGEPFDAGGASRPVVTLLPEPVAFGDLNGDGAPDAAVVLVSDSGGSGRFVYLAAVELRDGAAGNMATLLLGDRVQVRSLAVEGGRLVANLLSHAPDDPACCPTQEETRYLALSDGQFTETDE